MESNIGGLASRIGFGEDYAFNAPKHPAPKAHQQAQVQPLFLTDAFAECKSL